MQLTTDTAIGVIGAGTMGSGIAQVAATAGHAVLLYDVKADALIAARDNLNGFLNKLVAKDRISGAEAEAIFGRIAFVESLGAMSEAGFVIEAIVEDLDIKQRLVRELESHVKEQCIIATNTSSLSVTSIASASARPDQVIGVHFFNPAPLMKLVEMIPAIQTSSAVVDTTTRMIKDWGKLTVAAKDTPGFIVNRVARPFYSEALRLLEESMADVPTIDWAMTSIGGFRMGPFTLMDYIGNDINYAVTESVWKACYHEARYKPAFTQKRLVEAGYLGRKTGKGYYSYENEPLAKATEDETLGNQIVERIVTMLINEAADAVHWNVASANDIELAMTKGVNYPKGLLQWANDLGIANVVRTLDAYFDHYREERYRCSPLLRKMAVENNQFL